MNFFAHQEEARRQTRRMLLLFALAVVAVVVATDLAVLFAWSIQDARHARAHASWGEIAVLSVAIASAILVASAYRIATLGGGGGAAVARELGGSETSRDDNFAHRRLRNIVEEMAIASGVPVPRIFVLENEAGINAFASGYTINDAAITVTQGALDKLTRDELQGVIGHEFSHVLNGDMRLNIRLIGVVFGILVLATIGRKLAGVSGRSRSSGGLVVVGVVLFVVGYIGVVAARLIKASISRQREFLADASAVQFTRQTSGIAGALKKLGALAEGSTLSNSNTEEVAHMLFGDGVGYSALFATHPPLKERILRLDPSFKGEELDAIAAAWGQPVLVGEGDDDADVSISGFAPAGASPRAPRDHRVALPDVEARLPITPAAVAEQVGNPDTNDRRSARTIHATIPDALRQAAYQQAQAVPLIFALVLDPRDDVRQRQRDALAAHYDAGLVALAESLAGHVADLHPMLRLPLASLAFPALRRRPRPELDAFVEALNTLIAADGRIDLDEYCLAKLIRLQVIEALAPAAASAIGRVKLPDATDAIAQLFGVVAKYGHDDDASASRAYLAAIADVLPGVALPYAPPDDFARALDGAFPTLDRVAPAGKELIVTGLTRAISEDGTVRVAEAELLRVIAAALHCPLPPLLADAASADATRANVTTN